VFTNPDIAVNVIFGSASLFYDSQIRFAAFSYQLYPKSVFVLSYNLSPALDQLIVRIGNGDGNDFSNGKTGLRDDEQTGPAVIFEPSFLESVFCDDKDLPRVRPPLVFPLVDVAFSARYRHFLFLYANICFLPRHLYPAHVIKQKMYQLFKTRKNLFFVNAQHIFHLITFS
jgi:hypothetical protein